MDTKQKGFTLIELLIVVAILAILATVVILTLNPAQLLAQSRDSTRISDLATLDTALSLYVADVSTLNLGSSANCYVYSSSTVTSSGCGGRHGSRTVASSTTRAVDGTGWIPVNFNAISSGSPLSREPIDPTDNATYFYSYAPDTTNQTFELDAKMESTAYKNGGSKDVESTDGGSSSSVYEVGTAPGLNL